LVLLLKIEMAVNVNKRSNQFIQFVIEARAELFYSLKGQSHEISDPLFFVNLVHGLRPFRIWPRICRECRQYSNFSVVNYHTEIVSEGSLTPLKSVFKNQYHDLFRCK
jgi:hypothetical protein